MNQHADSRKKNVVPIGANFWIIQGVDFWVTPCVATGTSLCRSQHENRTNQSFDGVIERFSWSRCHSIQPLRATARRAFRGNLRWWANKTSPGARPESKTPGRAGVIPGQPAGLSPESGDDQREIPGSR